MHPRDTDDFHRLLAGTHDDPFSVLGPHAVEGGYELTVVLPGADRLVAMQGPVCTELAALIDAPGIFRGTLPHDAPYLLDARMTKGGSLTFADAYRFGPVLGDLDEYLFGEGTHGRLWDVLGAHVREHEGAQGTHFAVWAPNARRVSRLWAASMPGTGGGIRCGGAGPRVSGRSSCPASARRGLQIRDLGAGGSVQPLKADPVGFGSEHPPENASVVRDIGGYGWHDGDWMAARGAKNDRTAPISIYEVHLGSWRRKDGGRAISYREAAEELVDYVADMGFTHIELMPVSEYPFDGSWGYQPVGLFAPTIRHGPPHEFRDLVDAAHRKGLGVILDWVPGHFPTDPTGSAGSTARALRTCRPAEGFHQDWNTLIYNYGRDRGEELPRRQRALLAGGIPRRRAARGCRGLDALPRLFPQGGRMGAEQGWRARELRGHRHAAGDEHGHLWRHAGHHDRGRGKHRLPRRVAPVDEGGLGFGFKWNMGWMNDTLDYMKKDPVHRKHHHHQMTFGLTYAFTENFVLPISHDEVVHGKGSMLGKMPGGRLEERFANLRAYYAFMWGHPGKKLLFMGQEFAQARRMEPQRRA
jgi:1,4-alpha-glucan branching enzyme